MSGHPDFPGKFAVSAIPLGGYLSMEERSPLLRHLKFSMFAHQVLTWFESEPFLESVKLTTGVFLETSEAPLSVCIRHHFTLSTTGAPGLVEDANAYALDKLPYSELGSGMVEVWNSDTEVREHLALVADARGYFDLQPDYLAVVSKLARRIDAGFEQAPSLEHDIGIPPGAT